MSLNLQVRVEVLLSELAHICMTGRATTKHNCHLYKLSRILCPWCRDSAHQKCVVSSPAPPQWITCEHRRHKTSTPSERKWKTGVTLYIRGLWYNLLFFMIFKAKQTFSASLYCWSTTIPYPPLHVIISPESTLESTRAPFAVTYGEQGRDCKRVALSGAVT